jgi:hypothetical protein
MNLALGYDSHPAADLFPLSDGDSLFLSDVRGDARSVFAEVKASQTPGYSWIAVVEGASLTFCGKPIRHEFVREALEHMGFGFDGAVGHRTDGTLYASCPFDYEKPQRVPPVRPSSSEKTEMEVALELEADLEADPAPRTAKVYLIRQGESGPIKIGTSTDVESRLASLQTANPEPLHLLRTFDGDERIERAIHGRFAHLRLRGEWFKPAAELLAFAAEAQS